MRRSLCLLSSAKSTNTLANIVQGPAILQTSVSRPSPSLFSLSGLRSLPYWTQRNAENETVVAYKDPYVTAVVDHLEGSWEGIRDEYLAAVGNKTLPPSDYQTQTEHAKLHEGGWDWHSYMRKGKVEADPSSSFRQHFPRTSEVLQDLDDDLFTGTPFGYSFFSTLHPQSKIQPHTSPMNLRLRVHLGLSIPPSPGGAGADSSSCGIIVAGIKREWQAGCALVLDDSYAHAVWNDTTDESRVVLLVDIWHPDVSKSERREIQTMFQGAADKGWLSG